MKTLGNILWFILGGWIAGTIWVLAGALCCVTIIGMPFGMACFRIASFAYFPFGKELVDARDVGEGRIAMTGLGNFLWVVLIGLWTSICFILAGVAMCCGIVTIPFGFAYFKLAAAGFAPLGKRIVSTDMARVIRERKASGDLDRRTGRAASESVAWLGTGTAGPSMSRLGAEPWWEGMEEEEAEEEADGKTDVDMYLKKVKLRRKLDAAMEEGPSVVERSQLVRIRDLYLAGVEAHQSGYKEAAAALYKRAEGALATWRKSKREYRASTQDMPMLSEGNNFSRWFFAASIAVFMVAMAYICWLWLEEKAKTAQLGDALVLSEAEKAIADAQLAEQKTVAKNLQNAVEMERKKKSGLEARGVAAKEEAVEDPATQAQVIAAKSSVSAIRMAVGMYEVDNGKCPDSLQNLISKGNEINWNGPYLGKGEIPKDPWGNEFRYSRQGTQFVVVSAGPDGVFGSEDDIK